MKGVIALILKDLKVDWRNRYPVFGILLYLATLTITSYLSFSGFIKTEVWNALFWLIILFISINAIARSFIQEDNRSLYYYFVARPGDIIAAKLVYYFAYQVALVLVALLLFSILLGFPGGDMTLFFLNLVLGTLGLSAAFTMVSSIASRTGNNSVMMAILGFPVIIPVLILSISNSQKILLGGGWEDISVNLWTLASVNVIIIALSFILFPFTWKS